MQKTCFVIQGFGDKTDMATGRVLNLDASYDVIREAVQDAGLRCVRADEIVHSGTIDEPMYDALFRADLVIADLSTANLNAAYELGVRYGVRPRATIIVAEHHFKNPFDFSHIVIRRYEHLGKDIGRREAARFRAELSAAVREIVARDGVDSPVYTFLRLQPPREAAVDAPGGAAPPPAAAVSDHNAKELLDIARTEMARDNFVLAKAVLASVREMRPNDSYVVQQLALATYKSCIPHARAALDEASGLLRTLDPDTTNDPETLGLWGAVHKRLWTLTLERPHLDTSIGAYERGFYLKQDSYNGINLAFLLNLRASLHHADGDAPEAIADFVIARRVRREVVRLCQRALTTPLGAQERFWAIATLWEASAGLGDAAAAERWQREAEAAAAAPWMLDTARSQLARLADLLHASDWMPR